MRCAESGNSTIRYFEKKDTNEALRQEKKKLEEMVLKIFEKGGANLGKNADILKQSKEVDKLIVNEMLRHEMNNTLQRDIGNK